MDMLADVVNEIVDELAAAFEPPQRRAIDETEPKFITPAATLPALDAADEATPLAYTVPCEPRRQPKRAVRPMFDTHPKGGSTSGRAKRRSLTNSTSPAPTIPDESANYVAKPATKPRSRRKATSGTTPTRQLPSATLSDSTDHDTSANQTSPIRASRRGRAAVDIQTTTASAAPLSDGHQTGAHHRTYAIGGDEEAHMTLAAQGDSSLLIAEITALWRMRQRWHRAEKSLVLQGKALCRAWADGDKAKANALFEAEAKGLGTDPQLSVALGPFLKAIDNFAPERAAIEKRLRKLARSLPVWPWVVSVRGFGDLNLAAVVGEAGDVGSYRNPSCLWKRMGLAVIGSQRQRKVADKDQALAHGFSPKRRCVAYLIGDTLIKSNGEGEFRRLYDERKTYELERTDNPPKGQGHAHNRAARYMTKRALRRLWAAWREAERGQDASETNPRPAPLGPLSEGAVA